MITSSRMAMVDQNAEALGVPRRQLMESSGNAIARIVREHADPGDKVILIAGKGNNGGDVFVASRFLKEFDCTTILLARPESISTEIARANWNALTAAELNYEVVPDSRDLELPECDVIVDGLVGTGISGSLREPERSAVAAINESEATVLAVDVPSGIDADTGDADGVAVHADHIVTFHDEKPGLSSLDAPVTVADIGIPKTAELFVEKGDVLAYKRNPDSHKGDHGEVLVVGGGPYTGAPILTAYGALRAGADLVRIACPESIAHVIENASPDLIVRPFEGPVLVPGRVDEIIDLAKEHDVVVIGPGLGDADTTLAAVKSFLEVYEGTVVVDADGIQAIPQAESSATIIATPHRGELRQIGGSMDLDWSSGANDFIDFTRETCDVLLVKGRYDLISDGASLRVNRTGNPGMTVGGTGDVLAGVTAALAATIEPFHATALAAYANGRAGDIVYERSGFGLMASDIPTEIPLALRGR